MKLLHDLTDRELLNRLRVWKDEEKRNQLIDELADRLRKANFKIQGYKELLKEN